MVAAADNSCPLAAAKVEVGTTVKVETNNGLVAEGIVISMDAAKKVLVVDTKDTTGAKSIVRIFNSDHLKTIKVVPKPTGEGAKHAKSKTSQFSVNNPVNGTKTAERLAKTLAEMEPNLMKSNVPIRGQEAFLQLKRTIADTRWSGEDIRVLGLVLVQKPYEVANVIKDAKATGFDESRANSALLQVQKILSKPITEYSSRVPIDFTLGTIAAN
ncbi:hypothetical protein CAEBREN_15165 [Caenorhabditis brenneri]|uniref:AD domain-containing protein n=1 Tax=Caenorhabditis brenneri TaxID=135651 RepID=G0ML27_CAEBE|nr:hypothetical protein CAEBREN_15165 [Caenorhabditis brenneri]